MIALADAQAQILPVACVCDNRISTGLWSDPNAPTPPWQWRREGKELATTAAGLTRKPTAGSAANPTTGDGTCHIGPRGGTYTVRRSGRKNYAGC